MIKLIDCMSGLAEIPSGSVNCIVTSPPYNKKGLLGKVKHGNQIWGRFNIDYSSYGDDMDEGEYQSWMIDVINECVRVIKDDGSIFFNHKPRRHNNRCHLPTDFISRTSATIYQLIVWDRKNSPNIRGDILVPSTEHIYWLCKGKPKVFRNNLDKEFVGEVWNIPAKRQSFHPAPFPLQLAENCILLSTEVGDTVLDPFAGSGTVGVACTKTNRDFIGFDIDETYVDNGNKEILSASSETNCLTMEE